MFVYHYTSVDCRFKTVSVSVFRLNFIFYLILSNYTLMLFFDKPCIFKWGDIVSCLIVSMGVTLSLSCSVRLSSKCYSFLYAHYLDEP